MQSGVYSVSIIYLINKQASEIIMALIMPLYIFAITVSKKAILNMISQNFLSIIIKHLYFLYAFLHKYNV